MRTVPYIIMASNSLYILVLVIIFATGANKTGAAFWIFQISYVFLPMPAYIIIWIKIFMDYLIRVYAFPYDNVITTD